jgi:hypothetical protein
MDHTQIGLLLDSTGLKKSYIAAELFPDKKHPYLSLRRLLKGDSQMTADHIRKVAKMTGKTADEILGL